MSRGDDGGGAALEAGAFAAAAVAYNLCGIGAEREIVLTHSEQTLWCRVEPGRKASVSGCLK